MQYSLVSILVIILSLTLNIGCSGVVSQGVINNKYKKQQIEKNLSLDKNLRKMILSENVDEDLLVRIFREPYEKTFKAIQSYNKKLKRNNKVLLNESDYRTVRSILCLDTKDNDLITPLTSPDTKSNDPQYTLVPDDEPYMFVNSEIVFPKDKAECGDLSGYIYQFILPHNDCICLVKMCNGKLIWSSTLKQDKGNYRTIHPSDDDLIFIGRCT